jgi:hypothetical protein
MGKITEWVRLELKSPVQSVFFTNLSATATGPVFFFYGNGAETHRTSKDRSFAVRSVPATGYNRLQSEPVYNLSRPIFSVSYLYFLGYHS